MIDGIFYAAAVETIILTVVTPNMCTIIFHQVSSNIIYSSRQQKFFIKPINNVKIFQIIIIS